MAAPATSSTAVISCGSTASISANNSLRKWRLFNTEYLRYVRTAVSIPDIGYYYLQCSQSVSHSRVTTADILRLRRRVMLLYRDIYTELGIYPETRAAILRSPFGENEFTLPPLDTPQTHCCKL